MEDIDAIAEILTKYVLDDARDVHISSIQDKMYDVVNWLMPDVSVESAESFVERMKRWYEKNKHR